MAKVIFKIDKEERVTELSAGDRILSAGIKLDLDQEREYGSCGGNCSCATCHVHVLKGAEYFDPIGDIEDLILDSAFNYQSNSRLSCQLKIKPEHDEVIVKIP